MKTTGNSVNHYNVIPQNWLDVLLHRVRIEAIGRELFDASTGETGGRGCQGQRLTLNSKMEEKL